MNDLTTLLGYYYWYYGIAGEFYVSLFNDTTGRWIYLYDPFGPIQP
jgi:hypothetical protein